VICSDIITVANMKWLLLFVLQDLQSKPVDRVMHLLQQFDRLVSNVGVV